MRARRNPLLSSPLQTPSKQTCDHSQILKESSKCSSSISSPLHLEIAAAPKLVNGDASQIESQLRVITRQRDDALVQLTALQASMNDSKRQEESRFRRQALDYEESLTLLRQSHDNQRNELQAQVQTLTRVNDDHRNELVALRHDKNILDKELTSLRLSTNDIIISHQRRNDDANDKITRLSDDVNQWCHTAQLYRTLLHQIALTIQAPKYSNTVLPFMATAVAATPVRASIPSLVRKRATKCAPKQAKLVPVKDTVAIRSSTPTATTPSTRLLATGQQSVTLAQPQEHVVAGEVSATLLNDIKALVCQMSEAIEGRKRAEAQVHDDIIQLQSSRLQLSTLTHDMTLVQEALTQSRDAQRLLDEEIGQLRAHKCPDPPPLPPPLPPSPLLPIIPVDDSRVSLLQRRIDEITNERTTLTHQVTSLSDDLKQLRDQIDAVSRQHDHTKVSYQSTCDQLHQCRQQMASLSDQHSTCGHRIDELINKLDNSVKQATALNDEITTLKSSIASLTQQRQCDQHDHDDRVRQLTNDFDTKLNDIHHEHKQQIALLHADIDVANSNATRYQANLSNIQIEVDQLSSQLVTKDNTISALQHEIEQFTQDISTANDAISSYHHQLSTIETRSSDDMKSVSGQLHDMLQSRDYHRHQYQQLLCSLKSTISRLRQHNIVDATISPKRQRRRSYQHETVDVLHTNVAQPSDGETDNHTKNGSSDAVGVAIIGDDNIESVDDASVTSLIADIRSVVTNLQKRSSNDLTKRNQYRAKLKEYHRLLVTPIRPQPMYCMHINGL
jgi:DNA repair exonuclease SbcCD ATPase subunit